MKKYRVRYDLEGNYGFAYENLDARGIVHAFKLARDHMREIKKIINNRTMRIGNVKEIETND